MTHSTNPPPLRAAGMVGMLVSMDTDGDFAYWTAGLSAKFLLGTGARKHPSQAGA